MTSKNLTAKRDHKVKTNSYCSVELNLGEGQQWPVVMLVLLIIVLHRKVSLGATSSLKTSKTAGSNMSNSAACTLQTT